MATVRDFKHFVLEAAGTRSISDFCWRTEAHRQFWNKLNRLGSRNMRSQPPETVPDVDATVELSAAEWSELAAEFRRLETPHV